MKNDVEEGLSDSLVRPADEDAEDASPRTAGDLIASAAEKLHDVQVAFAVTLGAMTAFRKELTRLEVRMRAAAEWVGEFVEEVGVEDAGRP